MHQPSNAPDLTLSVLNAFGLRAPENLEGIDLYRRAKGRAELTGTAQVATLPGRYATRLGPWLLRGALGQVPNLCALDVDPACSSDVFEQQSIAARAVFLATYADEAVRRVVLRGAQLTDLHQELPFLRMTPMGFSAKPFDLCQEPDGSLFVSTQDPPQSVRPAAQPAAHAPWLQTPRVPVQAVPHAPQFAGSFERSEHTVPQRAVPPGQVHWPCPQVSVVPHAVVQLPQ